MSIKVETQGSVVTIVLSGGIDYGTQDDFKKANKQALSVNNANEIHVNFTDATFLDSAGIRALLTLQKEAKGGNKELILLNCNERMMDTFAIGGFDKMFTFRMDS